MPPKAKKAPEVDLTQILQQVAREKNIDMERWISALEDAMASAAKKQHRIKEPVRAVFDPASGKFEAFVVKQIVEELEDPLAEIELEEALEEDPAAEIGGEIRRPVSTDGLGRIAAQSAKQVLYQRIREAEREKVYNEFIDRMGEILNGTVKRFERGDIIVDLGRTEAIVPKSEQSRHERYSQGERIRAVIVDVHTQPKGPQIVLSRTDPRLLVKLFEMEVPEIYDGTVIIKNAVRAPGERAKVAVASRERDVDPVGACVGMKGSRVQSIIRELRGEKIDIIEHSDDLVTFAQSALAPAKITRVSVTHQGEYPHLDVIVEDEQLSLAIGKRGQNVRLASELIGARIDIKSETDVKDEVADALARMLQDAMADADLPPMPVAVGEDDDIDWANAPSVGAVSVEALRASGVETYADLLSTSAEELCEAEGVGPKTAQALLDWAKQKMAPEAAPEAAEIVEEIPQEATADDETSDLGNDDFMAALSRALAESEEQRARAGEEGFDIEALGEETTESDDSTIADSASASDDQAERTDES